MNLNESAADKAFRDEVATWMRAHLVGELRAAFGAAFGATRRQATGTAAAAC